MIYKLLVITICSFVLGQIGRFELGNGIVVQITDICVFFTVFIWFLQKKSTKELIHNRLLKPFIIFCLIGITSLVINSFQFPLPAILISSLYLIRWGVYGCLVFVMQSMTDRQKRNLWHYIIALGASITLVGFIQYFLYPNLIYLRFLGWDDHLFRLVSSVLDPNFAAVIICLLLFALLSQFFINSLKSNKEKLIIALLFIVSFIALLLTYSRSGYIMFTVGSIISLILLKRKLYLAILLLVFATGILLIPKDLHSAGVELWRTASIMARYDSAQKALKIITDHPIIGIGFSTYRYVQREYGFTSENNWLTDHAGAGTDNSWLFVLATTGVIGLGSYLYIWYKIIQTSFRVYKKNDNIFQKQIAITILASFAGLAINAVFINSLFFPTVMFWMWIMVGLLDNTTRKT